MSRRYRTRQDSYSSDSDTNPELTGPSKISRRALFFCELCEIDCCSIEALQNHFAGTKHKKKLGLNGLASNLREKYEIPYEDELGGKVVECSLCEVIFHGLESAFHFKSEKHRALCNFTAESEPDDNSKWLKVIADAPPTASLEEEIMSMDTPEKVADGYFCKLCSATLMTKTLFQAHIEGKRHQKKARWQFLCLEGDNSEVTQYWCRICNMFCTDRDALTAHYRGRNHIKTLQKKKIIQIEKPPEADEKVSPPSRNEKVKIKREPEDVEVKREPRSSQRSKTKSYRNVSPTLSDLSLSDFPSSPTSPPPPPPPPPPSHREERKSRSSRPHDSRSHDDHSSRSHDSRSHVDHSSRSLDRSSRSHDSRSLDDRRGNHRSSTDRLAPPIEEVRYKPVHVPSLYEHDNHNGRIRSRSRSRSPKRLWSPPYEDGLDLKPWKEDHLSRRRHDSSSRNSRRDSSRDSSSIHMRDPASLHRRDSSSQRRDSSRDSSSLHMRDPASLHRRDSSSQRRDSSRDSSSIHMRDSTSLHRRDSSPQRRDSSQDSSSLHMRDLHRRESSSQIRDSSALHMRDSASFHGRDSSLHRQDSSSHKRSRTSSMDVITSPSHKSRSHSSSHSQVRRESYNGGVYSDDYASSDVTSFLKSRKDDFSRMYDDRSDNFGRMRDDRNDLGRMRDDRNDNGRIHDNHFGRIPDDSSRMRDERSRMHKDDFSRMRNDHKDDFIQMPDRNSDFGRKQDDRNSRKPKDDFIRNHNEFDRKRDGRNKHENGRDIRRGESRSDSKEGQSRKYVKGDLRQVIGRRAMQKASQGREGSRNRQRSSDAHRQFVKVEKKDVLDLFEGFSNNESSEDEEAPPNTSLSVSYILNALRKSVKKKL